MNYTSQYNQTHKVKENHLMRKAIIYVRQSSTMQVRYNLESQRLQYGLKENATRLGWKVVETIDDDLGISAGGTKDRLGFTKLISQIALYEIGIVFSWEASRLSRNDKDWCQLMEVCRLFDTLIGDESHIYDLNDPDDQLILGIKGTLSVRELTTLMIRCQRAMLEKAKRGELKRNLTPGYIYDNNEKIIKDPNQRVQQAIELILNKFKELGSVGQVHKWFHEEGIKLPTSNINAGHRILIWKLPAKSFIRGVLHNPMYAGAYAYGKRQTKKVYKNGKVIKKMTGYLLPEEWTVLIKDHHEKYLTWAEYENNNTRVAQNCLKCAPDVNVGAIRKGQGLLVGILRCGKCGRKLHAHYSGKKDTHPRYLCKGEYDAGSSYCIGFAGTGAEKQFSKELLKILNPLTLEASMRAVEKFSELNNEKIKVFENQVKQIEYETQKAFEQYNEVDPRNRLVASELERRWNEKLIELEKTRIELEDQKRGNRKLSDEEKEKIMQIGSDFESVWTNKTHSAEIKKEIIRALIEEIIVYQEKESLKFIVHWKGGTHTETEIERPKSSAEMKNSPDDIEIIRKMSPKYKDEEIVRVLNQMGRKTGRGNSWSKGKVNMTKFRERILLDQPRVKDEEILTLGQASRYCKVCTRTIAKLSQKGILKYNQVVPLAPWEIKKSDLDSEPVKSIISNLKKTGKLILNGGCADLQLNLIQ